MNFLCQESHHGKEILIKDHMSRDENSAMRVEALITLVRVVISQEYTLCSVELKFVLIVWFKARITGTTE